MMASMKRLPTDLVALGLAAAVSFGLLADGQLKAVSLSEAGARAEAAAYLSSAPQRAELVAERWVVTDGDETAWLDARTGDLVEIEFAPPAR